MVLRFHLFALWISQVARVTADNAFRLFVVLEVARLGNSEREWAWHLGTILMMLPAVLLAPFNGAIANSLPKRLVLTASAACGLAVLLLGIFLQLPWVVLWGLIALSSAVFGPTRYAMLPGASVDTHWPLTRINGFFEMGAAGAVIAGLVLTAQADDYLIGSFPAAVAIVAGLHILAILGAAFSHFPSDPYRPESPAQAVAGFFKDCGRIWKVTEARVCLFGLASLRGLVTGMMGGLIAATLSGEGFSIEKLIQIGTFVLGGVALGSLLAGLNRHPTRVLGMVPLGSMGLTVGLIIAALGGVPGNFLCLLLGIMAGLVNVPLAATYQAKLPSDARGNGMSVRNFSDYVLITLISGTLFLLSRYGEVSPAGQLKIIAGLAFLLTVGSIYYFRRDVLEFLIEGLFLILCKFRTVGNGVESIPINGPVLIVANHSSYLDPLYLAKYIPRRLIPMMTSFFYDLPGMRWLMVNVVHAIRVEVSNYRREAPELKLAIEALDRGECVVIFPEGQLRRKEDQLLRQFGQGVWHILESRPQTPVVVCWIEGGWGSFFSYKNGPPFKNKPFDIRRLMQVCFGEPIFVPPEMLTDHRKTREFLMEKCLSVREIVTQEKATRPDISQEGEPSD